MEMSNIRNFYSDDMERKWVSYHKKSRKQCLTQKAFTTLARPETSKYSNNSLNNR